MYFEFNCAESWMIGFCVYRNEFRTDIFHIRNIPCNIRLATSLGFKWRRLFLLRLLLQLHICISAHKLSINVIWRVYVMSIDTNGPLIINSLFRLDYYTFAAFTKILVLYDIPVVSSKNAVFLEVCLFHHRMVSNLKQIK